MRTETGEFRGKEMTPYSTKVENAVFHVLFFNHTEHRELTKPSFSYLSNQTHRIKPIQSTEKTLNNGCPNYIGVVSFIGTINLEWSITTGTFHLVNLVNASQG